MRSGGRGWLLGALVTKMLISPQVLAARPESPLLRHPRACRRQRSREAPRRIPSRRLLLSRQYSRLTSQLSARPLQRPLPARIYHKVPLKRLRVLQTEAKQGQNSHLLHLLTRRNLVPLLWHPASLRLRSRSTRRKMLSPRGTRRAAPAPWTTSQPTASIWPASRAHLRSPPRRVPRPAGLRLRDQVRHQRLKLAIRTDKKT